MTVETALETRPDASRWRLTLELVLLFFALPVGVWFARGAGWRIPILPTVLVLGASCWLWLRRQPDFDRRSLWKWPRDRALWRRILLRFGLSAIALTCLTLVLRPDQLFSFPLERTGLWIVVMIGYPVISVLPQELAYRAFFLRRYRPLTVSSRSHHLQRILLSALAFGHVHIVFGQWPSIVLSGLGGVLFCDSYLRSRSIWAAWAEHALYGCFVFTVGLGRYFYGGAALGPQ